MKNTHITLVVDRSGSIASIINDFQSGLNKFIEDQKKEKGKCTLTLVDFDYEYNLVYSGDISKFTSYQVTPRGGTALRDAVGRAINETGEYLRNIAESERPELVVLAIITDGEENASKEYSSEQIKEMVEHQKTKYNWQFEFLCADEKTVTDGMNLGFQSSQSYNPAMKSAVAYSNLSGKLSKMRSCNAVVGSAAFNDATAYTEEEVRDMN